MGETPKETADLLMGEILNNVKYLLSLRLNEDITQTQISKMCSVFAIDKIIQVLDDMEISETGKNLGNYGQEKWIEVKNEIKKNY